MIQDIEPHNYDITFNPKAPEPEDFFLAYHGSEVLLGTWRDEYFLPRFSDFSADADRLYSAARHAFSVDGRACYLILSDAPEANAPFAFRGMRELRSATPRWVAFAGVSGRQMRGWYADNVHCGRCGALTVPGREERSLKCPKCGFTIYPKICPAVIVAITNGGRILVTHYANRMSGGYALVAGYCEMGERLEDAVHREVMEEVGLRVRNISYYKSQPWSFSDTLLSGFFCELDGGEKIHLSSELGEALWLTPEELPDQFDDISLTSEMIQKFKLGISPDDCRGGRENSGRQQSQA